MLAIITGASKGIGACIAKSFAKEGYDVVINYRSSDKEALEVQKECEAFGVLAYPIKWDASNLEECEQNIKKISKEIGTPYVLVNNAGITKDTLLMRMKENEFDDVISANLKSVYNMSKACSLLMVRAKEGRIINISSVAGIYGNAGQTNYSASKAGVVGFTKALSKEVGSRSITVNAISPGFIKTDMTDVLPEDIKQGVIDRTSLKRFGEAQDVADLALFLASDGASYITGQNIEVSGGLAL